MAQEADRRAAVAGCALASLVLAAVVSLVWAAAPAGPPPPRLVWGQGVAVTDELARFLREDQEWVDSLTPAQQVLTPPESLADARSWASQLSQRGAFGGELPAVGDSVGRRVASRAESPRPVRGSVAITGGRGLQSLLRDRWLARGYLNASVAAAGDPMRTGARGTGATGSQLAAAAEALASAAGADTPRVALRPGSQYRLRWVEVSGPPFPGRERLLARWLPRAGEPLRPAEWTNAVVRLLEGAGEAGHPFARWSVQEVRVDSSTATVDVVATLFLGAPAVIGRQSSDLPQGRGQRFLARATGLRAGTIFRESSLRSARERLIERALYANVGEPQVLLTTSPETVAVHWPVTPVARPNRLAAVLGLSRGQSGQTGQLSGQVDLLLPNLAGTGRRLAASWSDDGRERSRLAIDYMEPLAFGTPLDVGLTLGSEVEEQVYTRLRTDVRLRLPVIAAWGVEGGAGWDRTTFPGGLWTRTSRARVRGAFYHRRGDKTSSGWSGLFAVETARRQAVVRGDTNTVAAGVSQLERQDLIELEAEGELFARAALSLAARATFAEVKGEGGPIPLSEQYRFGGARSVRGYAEGQFRGEQIAYGSLEIRIGKPFRSRLYTFYDIGYFSFAPSTAGDPLSGAGREGTVRGFGLGIETRAAGGDVALAIGFPAGVDFDTAKLHVSLLQAF